MNFKIKSNWLEINSKAYTVKDKAFWVYLKLRMLEMKHCSKVVVSILMLYEELNNEHFKISKNQIIECLKVLRINKMIVYDSNKYRIATSKEAVLIEFIDLPETIKTNGTDKPKTEYDYYLNINTDIIDYIIDCGLTHKHVITYLYLSKFNKKCYSSCKLISDCTGLGVNQINKKYLKELELKTKLICNVMLKNTKGNEYNYFLICKQISEIDNFYKKYKEHFDCERG